MNQNDVKKAEGKLGILVVGLGAVSSTFITGVLMARKGLAKPVGSMTQYDIMRVGEGADKNILNTIRLFLSPTSATSYLAHGTYIRPTLTNQP